MSLRIGLCALYAGILAFLGVGYAYPHGATVLLAVLGAAALGAVLARFRVFREILWALALVQAAAAVLSYRIYLKGLVQENALALSPVAGYILVGIGLPLLVAAFICSEPRKPIGLNLPLGYEHVERHYKPMSAGAKLLLILLVCVGMVVQMMSGILFTLILLLPIGLVVYWIVSMLRDRKEPVPTAPRRISVPSQHERPVQPRNHWTINSVD